ncbi:MAG: polysaccharide lyase family 7 protein [Bacteroidota bacterium]
MNKPLTLFQLRFFLVVFCLFIFCQCSSDSTDPVEPDRMEVDSPGDTAGEDDEDTGNEGTGDEDSDDGSSDEDMDSGNTDGTFGLDPDAEPWENFDLSDWVIDTPAFDAQDGLAERYGELDWEALATSASRPFFFTHTDGGMRFVSTVGGAKTSQNTSFSRSELREMLRRGDRSISTQGANGNNWALGYQPTGTNHGGRNGVLSATLRVNQVTTTGNGLHPGRTIIGQIHADNDEPARLYYRKLPGADFGCVYVEHEIRDGDDVTFNLIGDERCSGNGPSEGIQLDELFSYEIINEDEDIIVRIRRGDMDGPIIAETTIDMITENSGYDRSDEWMYFKAGAYTQNNTGDSDDSDIVTFYRLSNTHDPN